MEPLGGLHGHTKEENEELSRQRTAGLTKLQKIGYVQLFIGVVACAIGITSLVYGVQDIPHWPYLAGFGLWIGILELIIGSCAILAGAEGIGKEEVSTKLKAFVMVNYIFSIISFSPCILSMVWSGIGISWCQNEGDIKNHFKCLSNADGKMGTGVATIVIALIAGVFSIFTAIVFCCYGKTFGFQSKRECRLQRQVQFLTTQLQSTQQSCPPVGAPVGQPGRDTKYYQWEQKN
ncbi:uncharacterized protein LOC121375524 [Gigantopelta aegis]|uniref:uncharacterized protein LOC121375524 n=1 Tax=Gigantopelta aegis TaxID=1735272 RepID=UPI001B888689|nr:uncharacterized protein LOC121375524 [Gigantopelta aegis]